jgi:predicted RNA binding protein YcfA (HicA-like mRNA interferase family)
MAKTFSGRQAIKILCKQFDFVEVSQKGSHVKLRKTLFNQTITTIVPLHKELSRGTFRGILDLAQVSEEDFLKFK